MYVKGETVVWKWFCYKKTTRHLRPGFCECLPWDTPVGRARAGAQRARWPTITLAPVSSVKF